LIQDGIELTSQSFVLCTAEAVGWVPRLPPQKTPVFWQELHGAARPESSLWRQEQIDGSQNVM